MTDATRQLDDVVPPSFVPDIGMPQPPPACPRVTCIVPAAEPPPVLFPEYSSNHRPRMRKEKCVDASDVAPSSQPREAPWPCDADDAVISTHSRCPQRHLDIALGVVRELGRFDMGAVTHDTTQSLAAAMEYRVGGNWACVLSDETHVTVPTFCSCVVISATGFCVTFCQVFKL